MNYDHIFHLRSQRMGIELGLNNTYIIVISNFFSILTKKLLQQENFLAKPNMPPPPPPRPPFWYSLCLKKRIICFFPIEFILAPLQKERKKFLLISLKLDLTGTKWDQKRCFLRNEFPKVTRK